MIFAPEMAEKILRGEKTVTRRPRKCDNPTGERGGWVDEPCRYKPGRTYAIQPGRGKKQVGRIFIVSVEAQAMCDMTDEDVAREGFGSRLEFERFWLARYGKGSWLDPVWRIQFRMAGEPA